MRWLEYGQRLLTRRRNLVVSETVRSTGRNLLDAALEGGAQACGRHIGRIETGRRADLITLDSDHPRLYRRRRDDLLDSWIFSGNECLVRDVYVGGVKLVDAGHHAREDEIARNYRATLDRLAR
jgi:formimidoylglutamate deiminase